MLRLDSIRVLAPMSAVKDYRINDFTHKPQYKGDILTSDILTADNLDFGISRITIDNKADNVIFDVSAKALKNDYASGINLNTFEQLITSINNTNVIQLDADVIYNNGHLLKADVTDNVKFDYVGNLYLDLALMPLSNKYDITPYNRTKNKGLVLSGKQKSFKERQIFYDKIIELKAKNKKFINTINTSKVFSEFKDTIRVETNFTQLRKIREYIGSNNLADVLSSKAKVNHDVFKKITKQANTNIMYLFDKYEGMDIRQAIRRKGIEGIILDAEFNWQYIDMWIQKKAPKTYRIHRKEFKQIYNELQNNTERHKGTLLINDFLNALSKVA